MKQVHIQPAIFPQVEGAKISPELLTTTPPTVGTVNIVSTRGAFGCATKSETEGEADL